MYYLLTINQQYIIEMRLLRNNQKKKGKNFKKYSINVNIYLMNYK